jgi:hypothetical protein
MGRHALVAVLGLAVALVGLAAPPVATAASVAAGPFTFSAEPFPMRTTSFDPLGYEQQSVVSLTDSGVHDATGVRMFLNLGVLYDHPVDQAMYALQLIHAYRVTRDTRYLDRAKANAQRLLDRSITAGPARFYPYPFDFELHGRADLTIRHPWYSAMAQGLALATFDRLFQVTQSAPWKVAADETFASFLVAPAAGRPWASRVDANGLLWFEEYVGNTPPDETYNGHLFATYGLVDYARLTGSTDAWHLVQGGLTTALRIAPSIRNTGWASDYCVAHGMANASYHAVHIAFLLRAYTLTGDVRFAELADQFNDDFPAPIVATTLHVGPGTIVGYQFSATGAISRSLTATLTRTSSAPVAERVRIRGRAGTWLSVSSGIWAGYYLAESKRAYIPKVVAALAYDPPRQVVFSPGSYVARRYASSGAVLATRTAWFVRASMAETTTRAVVNGQPMALMASGGFAGYWVPLLPGPRLWAAASDAPLPVLSDGGTASAP